MKRTLLATLVLLFPLEALHAKCRQADAAGYWTTYQAAFVAPTQKDEHVGVCTLKVDRKGVIDDSYSTCSFITFNAGPFKTGGQVTVDGSTCNTTIELTLGGFFGNTTMSTTKNTLSGFFKTKEGVSGTTNAVKIR